MTCGFILLGKRHYGVENKIPMINTKSDENITKYDSSTVLHEVVQMNIHKGHVGSKFNF